MAAWAFIHMKDHAIKYSPEELGAIEERIRRAATKFGIELSEEHVEKDAKLFEAGNYEDKGIEVTEADLERIAEFTQADLPLPIRVEHSEGPLHLGVLAKVWRKGSELLGRLVFTKQAWELVRSCGARKISIALRRDKNGIAEVSLVSHPRIADAVVFGRGEAFAQEMAGDHFDRRANASPTYHIFSSEIETEDEQMPDDGKEVEFSKRLAERDGKIARLEHEVREMAVDDRLRRFKEQGKLAPAAVPFARAILLAGDEQLVTFSQDGEEVKKPISEVFVEFLSAQPKVVEFSELAPAPERGAADFTDEDERLFARLGITGEQVAGRLR